MNEKRIYDQEGGGSFMKREAETFLFVIALQSCVFEQGERRAA